MFLTAETTGGIKRILELWNYDTRECALWMHDEKSPLWARVSGINRHLRKGTQTMKGKANVNKTSAAKSTDVQWINIPIPVEDIGAIGAYTIDASFDVVGELLTLCAQGWDFTFKHNDDGHVAAFSFGFVGSGGNRRKIGISARAKQPHHAGLALVYKLRRYLDDPDVFSTNGDDDDLAIR